MIEAFIQNRGVKVLPPGSAKGLGWYKPTATGNPREETEWLSGRASAKCNEENLAKAKVLTMLQDLGGNIKGAQGIRKNRQQNLERIQAEAHRWFFSPSCRHDFEAWCDTAGLDPDYVREKAQNIVDTGLPQWRAAAGQGKNSQRMKAYRERQKK